MTRLRLLVLPVALLVLSGCASSPETEVRDGVNAVLAAANDEDPDAVRTAVDELLTTLREQVGSGDLTAAEAEPVRALVRGLVRQHGVRDRRRRPLRPPTPAEQLSLAV